jgi:hypothetical protein
MSGGSLDYIYSKVEDCATSIKYRVPHDYLLQALAKHLFELADVLHDVEWDFSGDSTLSEEEREKIRVSIGGKEKEIDFAIEEAKKIRDELNKLIEGSKDE